MFDETLGRLNTSANIVGIAHAFSRKNVARYLHFDCGFQSQTHSSFTARIQIITSIDMLDEMLGHLNASPNICKSCWLKCWVKCWVV